MLGLLARTRSLAGADSAQAALQVAYGEGGHASVTGEGEYHV